jgi:hypothetical protein
MHRTQILLDPCQFEELAAAAERDGRSISSLVRDAITQYMKGSSRRTTAKLAEICGLGADEEVRGRDHDTVIYAPPRNHT